MTSAFGRKADIQRPETHRGMADLIWSSGPYIFTPGFYSAGGVQTTSKSPDGVRETFRRFPLTLSRPAYHWTRYTNQNLALLHCFAWSGGFHPPRHSPWPTSRWTACHKKEQRSRASSTLCILKRLLEAWIGSRKQRVYSLNCRRSRVHTVCN